MDYYRDLNLETDGFTFTPTTNEEILEILKKLDAKKSVGLDNIDSRFLKDGATEICKPVTELINLSIRKCAFPDPCKIAKMIPLYKKCSSQEVKNYRPIALLPVLSNIFERIIHKQTYAYLNEKQIFYKYQSGFRSKHSTDTCLSYLHNKISTGIDQQLLTGMVLIDLQKAFDTIDHNIFLEKI